MEGSYQTIPRYFTILILYPRFVFENLLRYVSNSVYQYIEGTNGLLTAEIQHNEILTKEKINLIPPHGKVYHSRPCLPLCIVLF